MITRIAYSDYVSSIAIPIKVVMKAIRENGVEPLLHYGYDTIPNHVILINVVSHCFEH